LYTCPRIIVQQFPSQIRHVFWTTVGRLIPRCICPSVSVLSSSSTHFRQVMYRVPPPFPKYRLARQRSPVPMAHQATSQLADLQIGSIQLTSGATYGRLPHLPLSNLDLPLCLNTAHSPKSDIFKFPLTASNRFSGLRSRCAIPLPCRNDCIIQRGHRLVRGDLPFPRISERNRTLLIPPVFQHQVLSRQPQPIAMRRHTDLIKQISTDCKLQNQIQSRNPSLLFLLLIQDLRM
jgi:hypothetical protein